MTGFRNALLGAAGAAGGGYSVDNSIVLDDGSSQYLSGPVLSSGSERIGTYSFWTKRGNLGTQQEIYTQYRTSSSNLAFRVRFLSGDTLDIVCENDAGSVILRRTTTQVFRDPHAFLHVHIQVDGNQTDDTCCTLTINGSAVSDFSTKTNLSSGTDLNLFTSGKSAFIGSTPGPAGYYDGYFSEFVAIDGGNAADTSFGEYDENGVWRPIDVTASLATNLTLSSVAQGAGTVIGDMTDTTAGNNLAAVFDGTFGGNDGANNATKRGTVTDAFVGKDWGSGNEKIITGFSTRDVNNAGYFDDTAEGRFYLYGSNSTPSTYNDGTLLYTGALFNSTIAAQSHDYFDTENFDTSTAYRYHWIALVPTSSVGNVRMAELYFYEDGGNFGSNGFYLPFTDSNALGLDTHASATVTQGYTEFQCSFDGSDAATSATDESNNAATITFSGDAQLDTAQQKFGTASLLLDGTGDYVSIPDASYLEIGSKDFTIDCWIRFSTVPTDQETIVSKWTGTGNQRSVNFAFDGSTSNLIIQLSGDGSSTALNKQESWSPSQDTWYHVAVERTGGNVHLYVNGTQLGSGTANSTNIYNGSATFMVGALNAGAAQNFTGHVDEVRFINGYGAYQGSNFTAPTTAYATPPSSNSFTPSGSPTQSSDSPTKNFCVLTPLEYGGNGGVATYSEGNLKVVQSNGSALNTFGSIGLSSGKWHYEVTLTNTVDQFGLGIIPVGNVTGNTNQFFNLGIGAMISGSSDGNVYNNGSSVATITGGSGADGQTLSCEIDLDNDQLEWFNNAGSSLGTYSFTPTTANGGRYLPCVHCNDNATYVVNFGASTFSKTPSTGFTGISAALLNAASAPAIEDGTAYFQSTAYTGNGTSVEVNQSGNSTFQPDFVWIKNRTNAYRHELFDAVRGVQKYLQSQATDAEGTDSTTLTSFDSDGYSYSSGIWGNTSGNSIVAWQWKGDGTSGSSNTDGSITSTVNVNDTAGFSIVSWTNDDAASNTVGHGLSSAPEFVIAKSRDNTHNWVSWHTGLSGGDYQVYLNLTNAESQDSTRFTTAPSATVLSLGSWSGFDNTEDYIAYCWTSRSGYSAFGSYVGNGSSDGPLVSLDFKPAWLLIKKSSAAGASWYLIDNARSPYNVVELTLFPDGAYVESNSNDFDLLSNGFKIRDASTAFNASGATCIYAAFAEHPFAGSSPATAR